jgi:hypothetical protein
MWKTLQTWLFSSAASHKIIVKNHCIMNRRRSFVVPHSVRIPSPTGMISPFILLRNVMIGYYIKYSSKGDHLRSAIFIDVRSWYSQGNKIWIDKGYVWICSWYWFEIFQSPLIFLSSRAKSNPLRVETSVLCILRLKVGKHSGPSNG